MPNSGLEKQLLAALMDRTRPGWRERRARRKSGWNLVGILIAAAAFIPIGYGLWWAAWQLHIAFYPAHAGHVRQFWQSGLSARAFISSMLLLLPLFAPTMFIALLVSNGFLWLIPPARRTMNAEAGGDEEMTFRGSNLGLIKWGGVFSGVALLLVFMGAVTLKSLR